MRQIQSALFDYVQSAGTARDQGYIDDQVKTLRSARTSRRRYLRLKAICGGSCEMDGGACQRATTAPIAADGHRKIAASFLPFLWRLIMPICTYASPVTPTLPLPSASQRICWPLPAVCSANVRAVTPISVDFVPASMWFIGGSRVADEEPATFYLNIKDNRGYEYQGQKAAYVGKVFAAIRASIGPGCRVVYRHRRCACRCVRFEGQTQEQRYIAAKAL